MLDALRSLTARDPARWPVERTINGLAARAKRYLKSQGWEILEPYPAMNIFVRAGRGKHRLRLMMHTEQTLGLDLLIRDCADKIFRAEVCMGILTQGPIRADLVEEAERVGLYLINPPDLANVETFIERANAKRRIAFRETSPP